MLPLPITIILMIFILGILVVAHELGHFVTAKRFGVEAPEFGIGMPPRLFTFWRMDGWIEIQGKRIRIPSKFRLPDGLKTGDFVRYKTRTEKGREVLTSIEIVSPEQAATTLASPVQNIDHGTIFTINALMIGGFVRMNGEDDPSIANSLASKPAWQRMIVLLAGVTMNFILAYLFFFILSVGLPNFVVAATTQVSALSPGMPAAAAGIQPGDTIVSINGVNVRDNKPALSAELEKSCNQPVQVGLLHPDLRGATQTTLTATPTRGSDGVCVLGVQISSAVGQTVARVAPGSLGEQMGLKPGDALAKVGGLEMFKPENAFGGALPGTQDVVRYLQENSQVPTRMPVVVVRDGQIVRLTLSVPEHVSADQATLGVTLAPYRSVPQAAADSAGQMGLALSLLPRTFAGIGSAISRGSTDTGVGGILRVGQAVAEGTPQGGLPFIISLLANLSFSLAVLNLLPIPGLDGGRLAFVILEVLRGGRKVDPALEGWVHLAGMVVLIAFIIFVTYGDALRIIAGKSFFAP